LWFRKRCEPHVVELAEEKGFPVRCRREPLFPRLARVVIKLAECQNAFSNESPTLRNKEFFAPFDRIWGKYRGGNSGRVAEIDLCGRKNPSHGMASVSGGYPALAGEGKREEKSNAKAQRRG